jgi:hypothetical protein
MTRCLEQRFSRSLRLPHTTTVPSTAAVDGELGTDLRFGVQLGSKTQVFRAGFGVSLL